MDIKCEKGICYECNGRPNWILKDNVYGSRTSSNLSQNDLVYKNGYQIVIIYVFKKVVNKAQIHVFILPILIIRLQLIIYQIQVYFQMGWIIEYFMVLAKKYHLQQKLNVLILIMSYNQIAFIEQFMPMEYINQNLYFKYIFQNNNIKYLHNSCKLFLELQQQQISSFEKLLQLDVLYKVYHVLVMKEVIELLFQLFLPLAIIKINKQIVLNLLVVKASMFGITLIIHFHYYNTVIKQLMQLFVEIG
ncbi:unnamed protein product [Paramecium primaurelia]|uniref:Transmembrane protein n=1 Tax=Paramecium primaurelia TaxID=5886 RepID=A0A8S1QR97_PARPR|nr:unnamed protein product [Paramecium primaurelia]